MSASLQYIAIYEVLIHYTNITDKIKANKRNSKKNLKETIDKHPQKEIFFFDESRFGTHSKTGHGWFRKGIRHRLRIKVGSYLYSAVNPRNGESSSLFASNVNTA